MNSPDQAVRDYVDALDPAGRALFDRFAALLRAEHPEATVTWAYRMPTFVVGERRLHVGVWKHGLSLYGWSADRSGGFCDRHPHLCGERGTLKLPHTEAAGIPDEHLRDLVRATFAP
ncbi:DUF1801 domain-containing protein [Blastococcus sp. TML/M2B]|uniref:DUF1801 domain-containing protein n=1 Tax=unclassified Blastococcus TaxID=2619396 RepID=UPI00190AA3EC|nr:MULTISPECIES: DUF1801 domain-containing protein [unclassified Blastococcus]MBN1092279.1 DUF1801 domain-containing protein [Blastococcus sp. TML/M2B]MBN1097623.1 DUF1801 domain-containing protein [Blastococcus sp. TML/C7B]